MLHRPARFILLVAVLTSLGCGEDKFQQELPREKVAVQLARETARGAYELITTDELKKLLDDKAALVLLDAMPAEEFSQQHLPGAVNFLFPKEADKFAEWDAKETGGRTPEQYGQTLGGDKSKLVVVYCGFTSCARSHHAATWAKKLGYTNVKRYAGGIYAWKGAGHSTQASEAR